MVGLAGPAFAVTLGEGSANDWAATYLHRPGAGEAVAAAGGHRAAHTGMSPAAVVARISTVAYLGSFTGPAVIGALAAATGLRTALLLPVCAVTGAALSAGALRTPDPSVSPAGIPGPLT